MPPTYLPALLLTLAIEVPVAALVFRRRRWLIVVALGINLVTHPVMHFVLPSLVGHHWLLIGEALALGTEALTYFLVSRDLPRSLLAAGLANGLSYAIGLLALG